MARDLIQQETFASVQEVPAGISRLLRKAQTAGVFIRVIKNSKPIGVLMPNTTFEALTEDLLALASSTYQYNIHKARQEEKTYSAKQVKKLLGL